MGRGARARSRSRLGDGAAGLVDAWCAADGEETLLPPAADSLDESLDGLACISMFSDILPSLSVRIE